MNANNQITMPIFLTLHDEIYSYSFNDHMNTILDVIIEDVREYFDHISSSSPIDMLWMMFNEVVDIAEIKRVCENNCAIFTNEMLMEIDHFSIENLIGFIQTPYFSNAVEKSIQQACEVVDRSVEKITARFSTCNNIFSLFCFDLDQERWDVAASIHLIEIIHENYGFSTFGETSLFDIMYASENNFWQQNAPITMKHVQVDPTYIDFCSMYVDSLYHL